MLRSVFLPPPPPHAHTHTTHPSLPSPPPPPQSAREKASKEFREARASILFSSDVSARGVDYPDVTMVLQARRGGGGGGALGKTTGEAGLRP